MQARRNALTGVTFIKSPPVTNPGLWLDKYLPQQEEQGANGGDGNAKGAHMRSADRCPIPSGYAEAFQRWQATFGELALKAQAQVVGRMVIGLGMEGALEAGIQLHHTWGVPFIPGSALKGVAAAAAHQLSQDPEWRKPKDTAAQPTREPTAYDELFGTVAQQGLVHFHDAWWDPAGATAVPLHLDVMTVHHRNYYQDANPSPPADTDSPTPVPFMSASGRYVIVVEAADPAWAEAAMQLLKLGLDQLGVGAKTNAGYGRLELDYVSKAEQEAQRIAEAEARAQALRDRARQVDGGNAGSEVPRLLSRVADEERAALAAVLVEQLTLAWLGKRRDQAWVKDLIAAAGVELPEEEEQGVDHLAERMALVDSTGNYADLVALETRAKAEGWESSVLKALRKKLKEKGKKKRK